MEMFATLQIEIWYRRAYTCNPPLIFTVEKKKDKKYPRYNDVFERQNFSSVRRHVIDATHASFFALHKTEDTW